MKWLLVLAGLLIGGTMGELPGAVVGALVGAGLVAWINKGKQPSASPPGAQPGAAMDTDWPGERGDPLAQRVAALEREVAMLRRRLDLLSAPAGLAEPSAAFDDRGFPLPAAVPEDAAATTASPPSLASNAAPEADGQPSFARVNDDEPAGAAASVPPNPPVPPRPGLVSRGIAAARAWLFGGNTVARMGVLVLFLGLSFLARYAVEHDMLPPTLRIILIAAIALALLLTGWRLRARSPAYAMLLLGGMVAALYLDVFAALRLYQLMPMGMAFGLSVAICVFSCVLAVKQNGLSLALLGAGGGFIAPLLVSTGSGNHVALFGYYLLLDLGIAGIALARSWRSLYLVGFFFTFMIGGLWGFQYYRPDHYASVQPFLAAYVLLFIAIVVIEARKAPTRLAHAIDGTLVFGPPLVGFSLQAALVRGMPWAAVWSAVAFGALYLMLALWLRRSASVGRVFLAIGIGFLTLAIPLAFDSRVTSAVWALEGAGVVWFGLRHTRWLPLLTGLALQLIASLLLLERLSGLRTETPFLNARWIGIVLIAGAALFSAWNLRAAELPGHPRLARGLRRWISPVLLGWGLLWWLAGNIAEFDSWMALSDAARFTAALLLLALTGAGLLLAAARADWRHAGLASQGLLPALYVLAFGQVATTSHPSQAWAGLGWLLALAVHERALRAPVWPLSWMLSGQHAGRVLLATLLIAWQGAWLADRLTGAPAWSLALWGLIVMAVLSLLHAPAMQSRWPIVARPAAYRPGAASVLAVVLMGWLWGSSIAAAALETGIRYLPLLNPVDLSVVAAALALGMWWRRDLSPGAAWRTGAVAVSLFFALNAIVLRAVAHIGAIPYDFDSLADSAMAQTAISLLWGVCALATMVGGARRAHRAVWLAGAVLLGLVVGKLFLVDLSNWSGLTRVVSFLGVGVLMLVIGYFAPMPPSRTGPVAAPVPPGPELPPHPQGSSSAQEPPTPQTPSASSNPESAAPVPPAAPAKES